jgi:signal transduction histidine kinase
MRTRRTIRSRLTSLYASMFFVAGALLLAVNAAALYFVFTTIPSRDVRERMQARLEAAGSTEAAEWLGSTTLNDPDSVFNVARTEFAAILVGALARQSAIIYTLTGVLATTIAWVLAGRALRPVQQITSAARDLSESNLSEERINLHGPDDELKELADTIDAMLDRLQQAFVSQRMFVANASHELRTPLSIMATEVDVTLLDPAATIQDLRQMGQTVRDAVDHSEALVEDLLVLASSDRVRDAEPVDLAEMTTEAVARHRGGIAARKLRVESVTGGPVTALGDRGLLERLVDNLVENAIRHNRDHGWVRVEVAASEGDGERQRARAPGGVDLLARLTYGSPTVAGRFLPSGWPRCSNRSRASTGTAGGDLRARTSGSEPAGGDRMAALGSVCRSPKRSWTSTVATSHCIPSAAEACRSM